MKLQTSITLTRTTRDKLNKFGKKDQTFDQLLNEILNHIEKCDRWWCENR